MDRTLLPTPGSQPPCVGVVIHCDAPPFVPLNGPSSDTVFHPQAVVVEALMEPEKVWTLIRVTADAPGSTGLQV